MGIGSTQAVRSINAAARGCILSRCALGSAKPVSERDERQEPVGVSPESSSESTTGAPDEVPSVSTALAVRQSLHDQAVVPGGASAHLVYGRAQAPDLDDSVDVLEDWSSHAAIQVRNYSENKDKLQRGLSDEEERVSRRNTATQFVGAGVGIIGAVTAIWLPVVAVVGSVIASVLILDGVRGAREWQKKKRKLELGEFAQISAMIQQWTNEKEAVDRVLRKMEREAYKERLAAVVRNQNQLPEGRKGSRRRRKKRGR